MKDFAALLDSLSKFAWPIIVIVVVLLLLADIRKRIVQGGFSVTIGSMTVSVQQASEILAKQISDLQNKLVSIETGRPTPSGPQASLGRILWVDDNPTNNAFEINRFHEAGYGTILAKSTAEGLKVFDQNRTSIIAVITDMGRTEDDQYRPEAGKTFIEHIRRIDPAIPIIVYSWTLSEQQRESLRQVGVEVATASPLELFTSLLDRARPASTPPPPPIN
jgi:CheY-like chemotaxis protein